MAQSVRAVYEKGILRPLGNVNLYEGQEIQLVILSEPEQVRAALAGMLVEFAPADEDNLDEVALMAEIDAAVQGKVIVSDAILEERREGP